MEQQQRSYRNQTAQLTRLLGVFSGLMLRLEEEGRLWAQRGRDHRKKADASRSCPSVKAQKSLELEKKSPHKHNRRRKLVFQLRLWDKKTKTNENSSHLSEHRARGLVNNFGQGFKFRALT